MPSNSASYQRDYRKLNPTYGKRQKALERARREALHLLAARYPQEFQQIYSEIKKRENL